MLSLKQVTLSVATAASRILNLRHSGISIQELNPYSNTVYQPVRSAVNKERAAHGSNKISPP
jgi:hypothetical protein